jgi:hypothetical protein
LQEILLHQKKPLAQSPVLLNIYVMKKGIMIIGLCAGIALASCKGKTYQSTDSTTTAVTDSSAKSTDSINNGVTKGVNTDSSKDPGTSPKHPNTTGNGIK